MPRQHWRPRRATVATPSTSSRATTGTDLRGARPQDRDTLHCRPCLLWRVQPKPLPMIAISELSARIAGRLLIDHASVTLPSGTKAGLVGKNGAGKSTLFRVITGEMAAESGSVSIPKNA